MKVIAKDSRMTGIGAVGVCLMLFAAASGPRARAQTAPPVQGRFGRAGFGHAGRFSEGKVVTGAPYSAQAVNEHAQMLADGNAIHTTSTVNVYRDSQGRTRREQEVGAIGPWAVQGNPQKLILITDPVAGYRYVLNPNTLVARQMPFRARHEAGSAAETRTQEPGTTNIKTESLGQQAIGRVTAQGTRVTRTIPAGKIGNQLPLVIVIERWYSPELQTDVLRKEVNPQFGEMIFQLTNIVRSEPDAALFQVPSNYTIKSGKSSSND